MYHRVSILALVAVVLSPSTARAEKAPLSPEELRKTATHVVVGKVTAIYTRTETAGDWQYTLYVAEIQVAETEKGDGVKKGDLVYARYWHRRWISPRKARAEHQWALGPAESGRVRSHLHGQECLRRVHLRERWVQCDRGQWVRKGEVGGEGVVEPPRIEISTSKPPNAQTLAIPHTGDRFSTRKQLGAGSESELVLTTQVHPSPPPRSSASATCSLTGPCMPSASSSLRPAVSRFAGRGICSNT